VDSSDDVGASDNTDWFRNSALHAGFHTASISATASVMMRKEVQCPLIYKKMMEHQIAQTEKCNKLHTRKDTDNLEAIR
jgi:hypothetical protein